MGRDVNELRQWMPVEIDQFFGSVWVPYMKDFQKWWFMSLLLNAWRNTDRPGFIPNDRSRLWMLAGAESREYFEKHCAIVIERFEATEDVKWLFNKVLLAKYEESLNAFHSKSKAGKAGAKARWNGSVMADACESNATACHISNSLSPVVEVAFEVEAFDFEEAFNKLCEIYPRSDRSYIAQTNFIKAVESVCKRKKLRRSEAAAYILSRTEIYVSKCKFISGLTKYLDSEVYDQKETMWESVVQGDGNGQPTKSEQRLKRNRENLEAGLRAFHGDSALDIPGFTGTKHRDPIIGTDAVVVSGPKVLPPRSD